MIAWLLRLHRWIALAFALPLAAVLVTSLILSFEPWLVTSAIKPGSLTADRMVSLLAKHDPDGKARAISYRSYDGTLTIGGRGGGKTIDVASGEALSGPSTLASVLTTSRRLHETLLLDLGWLVLATTFAMLVLAALGILMGVPRISNTVSGWHKAMSWGLLPLMILSPLTGIMIAYGVTFASPGNSGGARQPQKPPALVEAVKAVGAKHDLSTLVWLRQRGDRMLARVVEGGEYRVVQVTAEGTRALPRNWPRLIHEGNFAGIWSALMNVVTAAAMIGLFITGGWIWLRRRLRRPTRQRVRAARA
jgi:uncharacterized iron-regulated membrane protein